MQPREPSLHVLPEPLFIGPSLMKPAGTLDETLAGLQGGLQFSAGVEMVSKKIESFLCFADETLIGVNTKFEPSEHGMHLPDGGPKAPAGRGEDHEVIHEALVSNPAFLFQALHGPIKRGEIERSQERRDGPARHHAPARATLVREAEVLTDERAKLGGGLGEGELLKQEPMVDRFIAGLDIEAGRVSEALAHRPDRSNHRLGPAMPAHMRAARAQLWKQLLLQAVFGAADKRLARGRPAGESVAVRRPDILQLQPR